MKSLRTALDFRSFVLNNWRRIMPHLLVTRSQVRLSAEDGNLIQVDLQ